MRHDGLLFLLQVYLGEQYVNNSTLSDVTFLVEGCKYAFLIVVCKGTSACVFQPSPNFFNAALQVDDFMLTESAFWPPLMHFVLCLMVAIG